MAWRSSYNLTHWYTGARDSKDRFQQAQRSATGTQQPQGIASGWLHQFNVLLQRAWLYKIRDEMVVITQVTMACIMALLLGAIYFQQGLSQASIQSRVGAISFSMLLMSFIAFDIVLLFPKERDLYTRESQAGLYGASAFFHARCLAELPGHLTAGGAYATIAYWMMGFQNSPMKFAPVWKSTVRRVHPTILHRVISRRWRGRPGSVER